MVDVIAPARCDFGITPKQIKDVVHKLGFEARFPQDILKKGADLLCCNNLENRKKFLIDALTNKESKVVWALAGGYGTTQLMSFLDEIDFSQNKKMLMGFSDITALMLYFVQKYKWPCVHTRNIRGIIEGKSTKKEEKTLNEFLNSNCKLEYFLSPFNKKSQQNGEIEAECIGGNLSLMQCSLGTNWQIQAKDKILLLEDVDEAGYKIDRMLVQLDQAGVFEKLKAVIIGDFSCGKENALVEKVLKEFFEEKDFPVYKTEEFGHGKKNYPFLLGVKAKMSLGKNCKVEFNKTFEDLLK